MPVIASFVSKCDELSIGLLLCGSETLTEWPGMSKLVTVTSGADKDVLSGNEELDGKLAKESQVTATGVGTIRRFLISVGAIVMTAGLLTSDMLLDRRPSIGRIC
jgi:hypothetical protein